MCACYHSRISNSALHSQKCPNLDNELHGHPQKGTLERELGLLVTLSQPSSGSEEPGFVRKTQMANVSSAQVFLAAEARGLERKGVVAERPLCQGTESSH